MSSRPEGSGIQVKPNIHRTRGGYVLGFAILCTRTGYRKAELSFEVEQDLVVDRSTQPTVWFRIPWKKFIQICNISSPYVRVCAKI